MLESRNSYHPFSETKAAKYAENETVITVSYRTYKTKYATNKTVNGSYDAKNKTIEIIVNKEYAAKCTNLGNKYSMDYFRFIFDVPGVGYIFGEFDAKNVENATRNAKKAAKLNGWRLVRLSENYKEDKLICKGETDMSRGFMVWLYKNDKT